MLPLSRGVEMIDVEASRGFEEVLSKSMLVLNDTVTPLVACAKLVPLKSVDTLAPKIE